MKKAKEKQKVRMEGRYEVFGAGQGPKSNFRVAVEGLTEKIADEYRKKPYNRKSISSKGKEWV